MTEIVKAKHNDKNKILQDMFQNAAKDFQLLPESVGNEITKINNSVTHQLVEGSLIIDEEQKMKLIEENKEMIEDLADQHDLLLEKLGIVQHLKQVTNYHDRVNSLTDAKHQSDGAKEFVKKMNKERKEREKIKQERERQLQEKYQKEQEVAQKMREEEEERLEQERLKKKQEKLQKIRDREQKRIQFHQNTKQVMHEWMKAKPLYKVKEEQYKEEVELPDLAEKKKKLEQLRNMNQPIEKMGIKQHQRKYELQRKYMENEIKHQRDQSQQELKHHVQNLSYKPHLRDNADQLRKLAQEEYNNSKEEKKKLMDKVGNYAKYVKEMYWPQVSDQKKLELAAKKDEISSSPKREPTSKYPNYLSQKHHLNLKSSLTREGTQPNVSKYSQPQSPQTSKKSDLNGLQQKNITKRNNQKQTHTQEPSQTRSQQLDVIKSVDYLKQQRSKRDQEGHKRKYIDDKQWDKYLNDQSLNEYQRLEEMKQQAQLVEQRAEMDEKLIKHSQQRDSEQNIEKSIAVNDMYLEAIQAKLKLLDQI